MAWKICSFQLSLLQARALTSCMSLRRKQKKNIEGKRDEEAVEKKNENNS